MALAALLLVAIALLSLVRNAAMDRFLSHRSYEDVYYLPEPHWLRWLSLGHHEALADLLWIKALVYFGDEIKHRGDGEHIFRYGTAVAKLAPEFKRIYAWTGRTSLYSHRKVTPALVKRAVAFVRQGAERFPNDGELAWELGATLAYELAPLLDGEAKARAKEEALPYLITAARLGAGPPWLLNLNASELEKLGRSEQAARHLEEMYSATDDPDMRLHIAQRIQSLRSAAYAEAFELSWQQLEREWRQAFPYVPMTFYLLIRDPKDVPLAQGLRTKPGN